MLNNIKLTEKIPFCQHKLRKRIKLMLEFMASARLQSPATLMPSRRLPPILSG